MNRIYDCQLIVTNVGRMVMLPDSVQGDDWEGKIRAENLPDIREFAEVSPPPPPPNFFFSAKRYISQNSCRRGGKYFRNIH